MNILPDSSAFSRLWTAGKHQTLCTTLVSDTETPVSAMLKLGQGRPYCFLLESIEGGAIRGRYSIIGREPDLIWRCERGGQSTLNRHALTKPDVYEPTKNKPLDDLRALLDECRIDVPDQPQPMAAGLFGYLGYEMAGYMENIPAPNAVVIDVPESVFIRPTLIAIFDQIDNTFTLVTPVWYDATKTAEQAYAEGLERLNRGLDDLKKPIPPQPQMQPHSGTPDIKPTANMTEAQYCAMAERSKEYIRAGDAFQIVLSQRFSLPFTAPAFNLYRTIRRQDPSPFLFFFDFKNFSVVGTSPEILVRVRDGKITIRPIAGTRPRGLGNRTDAELAEDLLSDPKELAEHLMLLDLGRNDVGRFAKIGSVKVTARNTIELYKHVMHIVSNVEGTLDDKYTPMDAVIGGFPAGTVSGAPKVRAMQIIAELEPDRRGIYGGCIGYFGSNGALDTCIAIRTAVVKDGMGLCSGGRRNCL